MARSKWTGTKFKSTQMRFIVRNTLKVYKMKGWKSWFHFLLNANGYHYLNLMFLIFSFELFVIRGIMANTIKHPILIKVVCFMFDGLKRFNFNVISFPFRKANCWKESIAYRFRVPFILTLFSHISHQILTLFVYQNQCVTITVIGMI